VFMKILQWGMLFVDRSYRTSTAAFV